MNRPLPPLDPIDHMLDRLTWRVAFGDPVQRDDTTVVPITDVTLGFGYGYGFDGGIAAEGEADTPPDAAAGAVNGGGGLGGGGAVRPRGALHVSPAGVEYKPFVDVNRLFLILFPLIAWNVFWITRTIAAFAPHHHGDE